MCLIINKRLTKKYDNVKNTVYVFYKEFHVEFRIAQLKTPYQYKTIKTYGVVEAECDLNINRYKTITTITGGCCHAYINKQKGIEIIKKFSDCGSLIPIYVKSEDIIAAGKENDICFFKYEIKQKDWDNAFK
jgi:hypothetical protein